MFGVCPPVPLIIKLKPGGARSRAGEVVAGRRASNAAQKLSRAQLNNFERAALERRAALGHPRCLATPFFK